MFYFDFEKDIEKMENEIKKLKKNHEKGNDIAIKELKDKRKSFYKNLTPWQKVQLSRHPERPYFLDYLEQIFEDFFELHGDRRLGDDPSIVAGLGKIDGQKVMVIGQQKGRNAREKQLRNLGMTNPEGFRKTKRLMKFAEKFNLPVVKFIDTPGASSGLSAEEHGQAEAIASAIKASLTAKTPMISVIIGEGTSGGAMALAVSDRVLILEHAWFSVISPEQCASLLWKSLDHVEDAAKELKLCPADLKKEKLIDKIINEPTGGAHRKPQLVYNAVKKALLSQLAELSEIDPSNLANERMQKFTSIGKFNEMPVEVSAAG